MTRKDMVVVAVALAKARRIALDAPASQGWLDAVQVTWCLTRDTLADAIATTNVKFDRDLFLKACEIA